MNDVERLNKVLIELRREAKIMDRDIDQLVRHYYQYREDRADLIALLKRVLKASGEYGVSTGLASEIEDALKRIERTEDEGSRS